MALFEKKFCDICGAKIGLLGNRKLEDGNMCKDCAALLSPFMTDRRRTTLADIKEHLAYREANKGQVATFNPTKTIGNRTKVIFDEDKGRFIVSSSNQWRNENPDVIMFSQVTGCNIDIDEDRNEIKTKDKDGNEVSYNPPRYEYEYDFNVIIQINSPWFNEIKIKINNISVKKASIDYRECERIANDIKQTLTTIRSESRENATPKVAMTCPSCGATTIPDINGRCEYCGSAVLR